MGLPHAPSSVALYEVLLKGQQAIMLWQLLPGRRPSAHRSCQGPWVFFRVYRAKSMLVVPRLIFLFILFFARARHQALRHL
jgi:hypothetical protein